MLATNGNAGAQAGLHEDLKRQHVAKRGSERSFGLVFCAVFLVIGGFPLLGDAGARWWSLVVSAAFLVVALVAPRLLAPLNEIWHRFGLLLHRIVSPIVIFLMYCVGIVPTALVLRLLRKDLLRLKRDASASTYWIGREAGPKPETMRQQF